MIHILLLILKIIGITLLVLLALVLLLLFYPVMYSGKAEIDKKNINAKVKFQWLFHIIHLGIMVENKDTKYALRILGIPVMRSGQRKKKKKKESENKDKPKDKPKKKLTEKIKSAYNRFKEIKSIATANTTKEAYNYGKRIIIKLVRHIFPKKIKADMTLGFEEPHLTGEMLGVIAIALTTLHINPNKLLIVPDFEKEIFEGEVKFRGHFLLGVVGIYILKIYMKKEIYDIMSVSRHKQA